MHLLFIITSVRLRERGCCYPPSALLLLSAGCVNTAATDNHTAAREPHRFSKITQTGRMVFKISKKERSDQKSK
ncbi:hypothetical protein [Methanimicrococcus blatticola]|uniref:hypothetical protein n=1 Tax=Methanimicrococcus blatticola TaxID=91560 RepID=UPI0010602BF9|nr:hypothetical protein [Methanimicrococcus blatticola]MBZ3935949.1 hypothetical protein [Methanimicrococcus blatticola]MCC2509438.1 hypothetical protein [Methanimicrococcus blatticola]